jgi:uncharacterized protein YcfJ
MNRQTTAGITVFFASVAVGLGTIPQAQAGSGWSGNAMTSGEVEYARVVSVTPQIRTVQIQVPVRECEEVAGYFVHSPQVSRQNIAPTVIAGGVIGGLVGNNVGSGSGRDAARIFGTLAGAAIASDIARERQQVTTTRTWVPGSTQCTTRNSFRTEERLDGYSVTYEYRGVHYTTHTREHPGTRLPIQVTVRPML